MNEYEINEDTVTTTVEALYWISKIWSENPYRTKDEKEKLTKIVLDLLSDNIVNQLT